MTRKIFLGLIAFALMVALVVPATAQVNFKFGGWFRFCGIASDNQDRLDTVTGAPGDLARDQWRYYDHVFRPYFVGTMEDKARVFFQLDIPAFNQIGVTTA